jgi:hypothetical protein
MSDSAQALALKCSPNALSLNFMAVFSINLGAIEVRRAHAGEICKQHHTARASFAGRSSQFGGGR